MGRSHDDFELRRAQSAKAWQEAQHRKAVERVKAELPEGWRRLWLVISQACQEEARWPCPGSERFQEAHARAERLATGVLVSLLGRQDPGEWAGEISGLLAAIVAADPGPRGPGATS